jgi:hypothetical protein
LKSDQLLPNLLAASMILVCNRNYYFPIFFFFVLVKNKEGFGRRADRSYYGMDQIITVEDDFVVL